MMHVRSDNLPIDKGAVIRRDPQTGKNVYQITGRPPDYKDALPGFWDESGERVGNEAASRAGFDVPDFSMPDGSE